MHRGQSRHLKARLEACGHEGRLRGLREKGGPVRRTRVAAFIHYVWATWDRLPLLAGTIEREVYRAIGAKCTELDAEVIAIGGIEDHVHLLVRMPATVTIADLVGQAKGASAHLATHKLLPLEQFFKWQGAYAAFSVSLEDVPRVGEYIARQREHHARGTLTAAWELPRDEHGAET